MSESLIAASRVKGKTLIQLGSSLDVAKATELKKELTRIVKRKPPFLLDGSAVERIDTAGLQLLAAFRAETIKRDIAMQWDNVSITLKNAAELLGLSNEIGISD